MKNKVFVVLPVFNRLNYTKRCISDLNKQTYKNISVILIDDGSTDGTSDYVSKTFPKTTIVKGDGNWWWTKSMYKGVRWALKSAKANDFVLEMNNDLYFDTTYVEELVSFAKKHPRTIVGSMCVKSSDNNIVVESGIRIDWPTGHVYGVAQTVSQKLSYYKNMNFIDKLDALPGKGTLVPIKVFKKTGNFNYKMFPHYIADYEFTNRAKMKGFDLLIDTKAIAKHYWEATGISFNRNDKNLKVLQAWNLLFGRKSMNNIVDWINFVNTSCPKKYRLRNYYFSALKIVKAVLSTKYFRFLRPLARFLFMITYVLYYPKIATYRLYLKIKQFPEYHLK